MRHLASLLLLSGCLTVATPRALRDRQHAALQRGDVLEAVRLGRARVKQAATSAAAHSDLGCALARAGDRDEAVASVRTAITLGFHSPAFLVKDDDLASLRSHPAFPELVQLAQDVSEHGIALPGVRTVARLDLPTPLRLRLPPSGRPRLAIWLHPFGARLNADIERLAPVFHAHGYALAVPVRLTGPGWSEQDLRALLDGSVPALTEWVETGRPLLIGLSAGSHAALAAWAREPARFSGVIAGACAPELHGAVLPAGGAPIYVLNGEEDPATATWRGELPKWQREGRTVSLRVLPGFGHEFVFDEGSLSSALTAIK
ncbi:MAG: hypothetical protein Q8L48_26100 [Archangium sp.]|nr:hypothetical protein [Archangium sp.]